METRVHQLVGEDHRFLEADTAIGTVDQFRNGLLFQHPVDQFERQTSRQDVGQQRPAHGGVVHLARFGHATLRVTDELTHARLDYGV